MVSKAKKFDINKKQFIKRFLKGVIENKVKFLNRGIVLSIKDGIASIFGLNFVKVGELLKFDNGIKGMVLNLEQSRILAPIFGRTNLLSSKIIIKQVK